MMWVEWCDLAPWQRDIVRKIWGAYAVALGTTDLEAWYASRAFAVRSNGVPTRSHGVMLCRNG